MGRMKAVRLGIDFDHGNPFKWSIGWPGRYNDAVVDHETMKELWRVYFDAASVSRIKRAIQSVYYLRDEDEIRRELMG